jgi:hypothetical protein
LFDARRVGKVLRFEVECEHPERLGDAGLQCVSIRLPLISQPGIKTDGGGRFGLPGGGIQYLYSTPVKHLVTEAEGDFGDHTYAIECLAKLCLRLETH